MFLRTKENFVCENCGAKVLGNGYTNHCPKCLWSKHVDINPGDRREKCGGMMCPVKIEQEKGKFYILHKCEKCGAERRKILDKKDNFDEALAIAKKNNF